MPSTGRHVIKKGFGKLKELPVLPTLLTAGNLACGVTAILCAAHDMLGIGALLVFVAMFFDMLDGKVARMTGTDGEFGAELDSLSDVVAFGVAPAMLLHRLVLGESGVWGEGERLIWMVSVLYPVLTAIRLARYNVEHESGPTDVFRGLPSPGAAAVVCSWILLYGFLSWERDGVANFDTTFLVRFMEIEDLRQLMGLMLMPVGLLLAVLMVSTIPFMHVGNKLLSGTITFRRLILMILILASLIVWHVWTLALVTTGYVLLSLFPGLIAVVRAWSEGRQFLDEDDEEAPKQPQAGLTEKTQAEQ